MTDLDTAPITPSTVAEAEARLHRLRELAAAHRTRVVEAAAQHRREQQLYEQRRRDSQRREAAQLAAKHVRGAFPDTLGQLLEKTAWAGYPQLDINRHGTDAASCAVTSLGGGMYLHHSRRPAYDDYGLMDTVTLLRPCPCGNYLEVSIADDDELADALDDAARITHCVRGCTPSGNPADTAAHTTPDADTPPW